MSTVDAARDVSALAGPYVGLNFYTQEKAAIFFGRDRERTVLISNLRAARLTLLYAKSGTGKSSLLRAGVAARLAELARHSFDQRGTARNIPVVFSSWRDDPTAELMGEIHEAIGPFRTGASPAVLTGTRLDAAIEAASRATDATLLVILDQFEEYLIYRSRETRDRPFADELAACINRADLRAKFLISIREDAYFALGDLFKGRISNVYGNYFHLEHLTREAAREAIEKPISSFHELHPDQAAVQIEPTLVDAVLDQFRPDQLALDQGGAGRVAGGDSVEPHRDEVEASYLQLVMKRLWDVEQEKHSAMLRLETLEELGGAQAIVRTHVDRALEDLPDRQRTAAVAILRHLVTPSRTKIALTASDLVEYTGSSPKETNALLERLADSKTRILRPVPPPHGQAGGTRFEISHDLLAPAILNWDRRQKAVRLEQQKEAAERRVLVERRRAYLNLRLCIGAIGLALPFILIIGSAIFPPDPYSVSAYYYSAERNILVASLCVLGAFLLIYQGYDKLDSRITNVCGAATIGVALFPTSNPGFKPAWVGHVHPVVAGIALAGQALMALQFTQSAPRDVTARWRDDVKRMLHALIFRYDQRIYYLQGKKLTRNRIYSACAWLIIIGVVLALDQNFLPDSIKAETRWLFWLESLSIASFGVAWLVKGQALVKDAATPDQAVPVEATPPQAMPADATVEVNRGR